VGPERIIEQIRRLRALATSSNEHEAAAAAAKAQELLLKYNISIFDIPDDPVHKEDIEAETVSIKGQSKGDVYRWKVSLMSDIAKYNFCQALLQTHKDYSKGWKGVISGRSMIVIGKAHDREVVFFLFQTLVATLERLAERYPKRNPPGTPPQTWGPQKSFLFGATAVIGERLRDTYIEAMRVAQADPTSKALVVVNTSQRALDLYARTKFVVKKGVGLGDHDRPEFGAYMAGRAAGAALPLNKGVKGEQREGRRALQKG